MQTIESIFEKFFDDIGKIEYMGVVAYESTMSELRNLAANSDGDDMKPVRWRRIAFRNAYTGKLEFNDARSYSLEDIKQSYIENLNKQCQWFLVDAYELFEKFLYHAYAFVGFIDPKRWRCTDFGDAYLSEVEGKDYPWFLARVRAAYKNKPDEILKRMRTLYPEFAELENKNALSMPLRFSTAFAEKLRHHVVHAGGRLESISTFLLDVFKKSGIAERSQSSQELSSYCSIYFSENDDGPTISMLNASEELAQGIVFTHSPLEMACALLLSHAHALTQEIKEPYSAIKIQS